MKNDRKRSKLLNREHLHDTNFLLTLKSKYPSPCNIPRLNIFLFFGISTLLDYIIVKRLNVIKIFPDYWIYYFIGMVIIFFGIFSLDYARKRHLQVFSYILPILGDREQLNKLDSSFGLMFHKRLNLLSFISFASIGILFHQYLFSSLPSLLKIYNLFFVIIPSVGIAGMGFYLAITSCLFVKSFANIDNWNLNPIAPANSLGIKMFKKLILLYFTLFTVEFLLWMIEYVILISRAETYAIKFHLDEWPFVCGGIVITIILILIVPIYIFYPFRVLKNMLARYKHRTIVVLEQKIIELFNSMINLDNISSNRFSEIKEYHELLKVVQEHKTSPIDLGKGIRNSHYFIAYIISLVIVAASRKEELKLILAYSKKCFAMLGFR